MFKNLLDKFSSSSFGIHISDGSIKFVELKKSKNGFQVSRFGERKIPAGTFVSGKVKNSKNLVKFLTALGREVGVRSAHISLSHGLLDAGITEDIFKKYNSVFENSLIRAKSFGLEAEAIAKSVLKKDDKETYMIIDFGRKRTGIFIISEGVLMFASILEFSGEGLTDLIKNNLNISFEKAEKIKREFGLKRNPKNKELCSILLQGFSVLRDEINRYFTYWHIHKDESGNNRPPIRKIILCGSDANIAGLPEYISVVMKHKVEMANVWTNIMDAGENIPEMDFEESLKFAPAFGVALKGFYK